jgi:hypothetical protein
VLAGDLGLVEEVGGQEGAGVEDLDAGELAVVPVEAMNASRPGGGLARVVACPAGRGWLVRCRQAVSACRS